jgi:hypothetical protein
MHKNVTARLIFCLFAGALAAKAQTAPDAEPAPAPAPAPTVVPELPADSQSQSEIVAGPEAPLVPASLEHAPTGTNQTSLFGPASSAPAAPDPFQWGDFSLHPHLFYNLIYGNGVQAAPGHPSNTVFQSVSPGILALLGAHWTFDYTPTWNFYSGNSISDTVGQSATLTGAAAAGDWTFKFGQSYLSTSSLLIDTGGLTTQRTYTTDLEATDSLSRQFQLDTTVEQTIASANDQTSGSPYPDFREWSGAESLRYLFSPRTDASIGVFGGFTDEIGTAQLITVGPKAAIDWRPTDKLTFNVHGGFETQIFLNDHLPDRDNPLLGASALYQPFEATTMSFSVDHTASYDNLTSQANTSSIWSANLEQRLLHWFIFTAGVSGNTITYDDSDMTANRSDQLRSYSVGIGTTFLQRGTILLSYQVNRNSSNLANFDLSDHEIELTVGYQY